MDRSAQVIIDRLAETHRELQFDEDRAAYWFAALAMLGIHAPDVLEFILDRTAEKFGGAS